MKSVSSYQSLFMKSREISLAGEITVMPFRSTLHKVGKWLRGGWLWYTLIDKLFSLTKIKANCLNKYHLWTVNKNYSLFSLRHHAPVIWNNLPLEIKSLNSMNTFKRKLKSYLITSVWNFKLLILLPCIVLWWVCAVMYFLNKLCHIFIIVYSLIVLYYLLFF